MTNGPRAGVGVVVLEQATAQHDRRVLREDRAAVLDCGPEVDAVVEEARVLDDEGSVAHEASTPDPQELVAGEHAVERGQRRALDVEPASARHRREGAPGALRPTAVRQREPLDA